MRLSGRLRSSIGVQREKKAKKKLVISYPYIVLRTFVQDEHMKRGVREKRSHQVFCPTPPILSWVKISSFPVSFLDIPSASLVRNRTVHSVEEGRKWLRSNGSISHMHRPRLESRSTVPLYYVE
jgi:hypothetical protein